MQNRHVVVLKEGIDPQLPVHLLGPDVAAAVAVVREPEGRKLRAEIAEGFVEVERAGGVEQQPDETVALLGREAHQARLADRDVGEVLGRRLRPEHAAPVIGPIVVGADERLADAAGAIQQAGAAVPAGVEQALHRAVVGADQQHRHACDIEREIVAGLRDLTAEGEGQRVTPEERRDLVGEGRLAGIAGAVHRHRGVGLRQGLAADAVERLGGEALFGLGLHRSLFAVVSFPSGRASAAAQGKIQYTGKRGASHAGACFPRLSYATGSPA